MLTPVLASFISFLLVEFAVSPLLSRELEALEFFLYLISFTAALLSVFSLVIFSTTTTKKGLLFLANFIFFFFLSLLFGIVASTETDSVDKEFAERQRVQMEVDMFRLNPFAYTKEGSKMKEKE